MTKIKKMVSAKKVMAVMVLGLISGALLGAQQAMTLTPELESQVAAQLGSKQVIILIAMLQTAALASLATIAGVWASPKVHLNKPFAWSRTSIAAAVSIGLLSASFIAIAEKLVFAESLGLAERFEFSWLYFLGSVLYGGIIEELLLRFGLMSIIIWLASKLTKTTDRNGIYIAGMVMAALIFAAGHLPATAQMLGLSTVTVIRTLLLNFLPGIGFGYLYWKHGLAYAMLGHIATHVINQLVLLPILFNVMN
ncbi:CPBP family intramembrane glutamic endopeptidase [Paenibacillus sp. FSL K6-2441]|uniref:CPBP family intramembrane glutamic endopeptidase n=1 Tax=Paenibacillus sp. FSL K6-2441 TaxID=2954679 RepID=UPI0030DACE6F